MHSRCVICCKAYLNLWKPIAFSSNCLPALLSLHTCVYILFFLSSFDPFVLFSLPSYLEVFICHKKRSFNLVMAFLILSMDISQFSCELLFYWDAGCNQRHILHNFATLWCHCGMNSFIHYTFTNDHLWKIGFQRQSTFLSVWK
jgi:hypothetical protein